MWERIAQLRCIIAQIQERIARLGAIIAPIREGIAQIPRIIAHWGFRVVALLYAQSAIYIGAE